MARCLQTDAHAGIMRPMLLHSSPQAGVVAAAFHDTSHNVCPCPAASASLEDTNQHAHTSSTSAVDSPPDGPMPPSQQCCLWPVKVNMFTCTAVLPFLDEVMCCNSSNYHAAKYIFSVVCWNKHRSCCGITLGRAHSDIGTVSHCHSSYEHDLFSRLHADIASVASVDCW